MSARLLTRLGPMILEHPVINASGTLDLLEVAEAVGVDIHRRTPVAAYVPKTVTAAPREGNATPRVAEVRAGMVNSIGLPNEGVEGLCGSHSAAVACASLPRDRERGRLLA